MIRLRSALRSLLKWLASPKVVFYLLPWLLVLLTLGTVSQRYIGLYYSEKLFFGSFILWIGLLPLPGAYLTLLVLTAGLLAKLTLKSPLRKRTIGTVITHLSILLLLLGGLLSALTRQEGYITLAQDETSSTIADYYDREMVIVKNNKPFRAIPYRALSDHQTITAPELPFKITVEQKCYPCAALPLSEPDTSAYGMASAMKLVNAQPNPDDALNHAGAMLMVDGAKKEQNGKYIIFESLAKPPAITVGKDEYVLLMRPAERALPFVVSLKRFEQENHPGTSMAREYRSELEINDGGLKWTSVVSMNQPLRYRGYTIYQSSFIENGENTASVLAVVNNTGWLFPYLSLALLTAGLTIHMITRRKPAIAVLAFAGMMLIPQLSHASIQDFDYSAFAQMPVLHEGRVKPLDSFARALLKGMSGDTHADNNAAVAWLCEMIFSPSQAAERPLFVIKSPVLQNVMKLTRKPGSRYSFSELVPLMAAQEDTIRELLDRDVKSYSESERELVNLFEMMNRFSELMSSLSLFVPLDGVSDELKKEIGLPADSDATFYNLLKVRHIIMEKLKAIIANKKNNVAKYTPLEQDIAKLAFRMDTREAAQRSNSLLRVIPGEWENKEEWLSLWQVVIRSLGSPRSATLFAEWTELLHIWKNGDAVAWKATSQKLQSDMLQGKNVLSQLLALEVMYHDINPLQKSELGYGITIILALLAVALQRGNLRRLALFSLLITIGVHGAAVLARMIILGRPPVSTLYESMLFVSLVASLSGFIISWRRGWAQGVLAGSIVGLMVLLFADIFAGNGDTLEMLTAVLNTNFWLGTHVVCITAGYGFSLLTGVFAHFYLFRRAMASPYTELAEQYRLLQTLALISLIFTSVGTMLGGIWADQSWGRFWGWDPKENGALAIVLWLIWAIHGRLAGQLRETAFAAVLAFTTVVVALAWVGVNLLSVGLHSYGFSDAAAWGLPLFSVMEIVIISILAMLSSHQLSAIEISKARTV